MKIPTVDHSKTRLVYATQMMTAREFRKAARQFREQEAAIRRNQFRCTPQMTATSARV